MISRPEDGEDVGRGGEGKRKRRRASEETRAPRTRTLVVVPALKRWQKARSGANAEAQNHSPENRLAEAVGLAKAIDLDV
ncbi:MAG TPA: GTPase HflX, partial [Hyphomicrobium sp.]|nr:GTPase HflX [Hyphomicrobium sp.]